MNSAKTFALVMLIINGLYLLCRFIISATTDWDVLWNNTKMHRTINKIYYTKKSLQLQAFFMNKIE